MHLSNNAQQITLLYTNIRSIQNKLYEFHSVVEYYSPQIIGLTETWLNNVIQSSYLSLPSYTIYRNDRNTRGGGVLLAINSKLKSCIVQEQSECEILAVDIMLLFKKIRVICVYIPPNVDSQILKDYIKTLSSLTHNIEKYLILGDFNFPNVNWKEKSFPNETNYQIFSKYFFENQPLYQIVRLPTRGNNVLDILLTNDKSIINSYKVDPPVSSSDHNLLVFNLKLICDCSKPFEFLNYKRANIEEMTKFINNKLLESNDIANLRLDWENFISLIKEATAKFTPKCYEKVIKNSWIDNKVKSYYRKYKRLHRKLVKKFSDTLRVKCREAKKLYKKTCKLSQSRYLNNLIEQHN